MNVDEHELSSALTSLTAGQPTQPADRLTAVHGRAKGLRRRRTAERVGSALAVVALFVGGAVLLGGSDHRSEQTAGVESWPDRSVAKDRGVAEGAVAAFTHSEVYGQGDAQGLAPVRDVRWLYRAPVRLPDGTTTYVAVFVATYLSADDGHELRSVVIATTDRASVDAHGNTKEPDTSPWTLDTVDLSSHPALDHIGVYLPYGGATDHANAGLVLGPPNSRTLRWHEQPLPFAPARQPQSGAARSSNGVFHPTFAELTGPVTIALDRDAEVPVATGLSQPDLTPAAAPDLPGTWQGGGSGWGQSERHPDGTWDLGLGGWDQTFHGKRLSIFGRCYGGGSAHVTVTTFQSKVTAGGGMEAEGPEIPVGQGDIPCDGRTHRAFSPHTVARNTVSLIWKTDRLQAVHYSYGSEH